MAVRLMNGTVRKFLGASNGDVLRCSTNFRRHVEWRCIKVLHGIFSFEMFVYIVEYCSLPLSDEHN